MQRRICVVGLGHFGGEIARALAQHAQVLAIDSDMSKIEAAQQDVQRAVCLDARDQAALASVVSRDFDEAIVSIGENVEASILCTLHLKRIGVPVIRAKADGEDHAEILRAVGATHVVFPERETALRMAAQVLTPNLLDAVPLAQDYRLMDLAVLPGLLHRSLLELELRPRFGLFVIAVKRVIDPSFVFLPGPSYQVTDGDILVVIGRERDLLALQRAYGNSGGGSAHPAESPPVSHRGDDPPREGSLPLLADAGFMGGHRSRS